MIVICPRNAMKYVQICSLAAVGWSQMPSENLSKGEQVENEEKKIFIQKQNISKRIYNTYYRSVSLLTLDPWNLKLNS